MRFLSRDISNDVAAFFVNANRAFNHGNACSWALICVVVAVLERIRRFPFCRGRYQSDSKQRSR